MDLSQDKELIASDNISEFSHCCNCGKADQTMENMETSRGFEPKTNFGEKRYTNNHLTYKTEKGLRRAILPSLASKSAVYERIRRHSNQRVARDNKRCYGLASVIQMSANSHNAACLVQSVIFTLFLLVAMTVPLSSAAPELLQVSDSLFCNIIKNNKI